MSLPLVGVTVRVRSADGGAVAGVGRLRTGRCLRSADPGPLAFLAGSEAPFLLGDPKSGQGWLGRETAGRRARTTHQKAKPDMAPPKGPFLG